MKIDHTLANKDYINRYKMAHIIRVAEKMKELSTQFGLDGDEMYVVGFLHDIGYLNGRVGHENYGADMLQKMGLSDRYVSIIKNHGADVSTLDDALLADPVFALLMREDYEVGTKGHLVSRQERIDEILSRCPGADVEKNLHNADLYLSCVEGHEKDLSTAVAMYRDALAKEKQAEAEKQAAIEAAKKAEEDARLAKLKAAESEAKADSSDSKASADTTKDEEAAPAKPKRTRKSTKAAPESLVDKIEKDLKADVINTTDAVKRLRAVWEEIIDCYNETCESGPDATLNAILQKESLSDVVTVFSIVAQIKIHDGRIYGVNRDYMNERFTTFANEHSDMARLSTKLTHDNPFFYGGLDKIHTAHIDNMISAIRTHIRNAEKNDGKKPAEPDR